MHNDARSIAEAYAVAVPKTPVPTQSNEEKKEPETPKPAVKDWLRLEPGLYPIDTVRKADHTAHVLLQFIYSVCASPDAVHRVFKTLNKAYKQDKK